MALFTLLFGLIIFICASLSKHTAIFLTNMVTRGEVERGINWETGIDIYTLLNIREIDNKYALLYSTGTFTQYSVIIYMEVWSVSHSVVPDSLWLHGLQPTRLLCPWDFPSKDTGLGCHFLLQGIFPNQGSNPGLLHYRQILYQLKSTCKNESIKECVCIYIYIYRYDWLTSLYCRK